MDDVPQPVDDAPQKPRRRTSLSTWVCTALLAVAGVAGGYGWHVTKGAGRTVDASEIEQGMTRVDVARLLGSDPDDYVTVGDETAMRYGRTHIWTKGMPGRVTKITIGPR
jgi:hypothetical protein